MRAQGQPDLQIKFQAHQAFIKISCPKKVNYNSSRYGNKACLRTLNKSLNLGQGESWPPIRVLGLPPCALQNVCRETGWNPSPFTQSQSGWQLEEKPLSAIAEQIFSYPGKRQRCYLRVFIGVRDWTWNSGGRVECRLLVVSPRSED